MNKSELTIEDKLFIGYSYKILRNMIEKLQGRPCTKKELKDLRKKLAKGISKEL
jgi:hypothetical protein